MKRLVTLWFAAVIGLHTLPAQDTFSIIAVDSATGEVGAAGASCVDGIALYGGIIILNDMIPGRGGVNAQAWICINPHTNLDNAITKMDEGLAPDSIISWLQANDGCSSQNYDPAYRQYGIVDFDSMGSPRTAAFTGDSADDYKGHRLGPDYAIQGNILLGPEILDSMEARFNRETGPLAYKLMAAMQGANVPGADSRCLARGTSSTSSFLRVVKPTDDMSDPYLELNVAQVPYGEEPIDSLQTLFNQWCCDTTPPDQVAGQLKKTIRILSGSQPGQYTIVAEEGVKAIVITDVNGREINTIAGNNRKFLSLDMRNEATGMYLLRFITPDGRSEVHKVWR